MGSHDGGELLYWHNEALVGDNALNYYLGIILNEIILTTPPSECSPKILTWWEARGMFQEETLYQRTVPAALHPSSPVRHLLLDRCVGSDHRVGAVAGAALPRPV